MDTIKDPFIVSGMMKDILLSNTIVSCDQLPDENFVIDRIEESGKHHEIDKKKIVLSGIMSCSVMEKSLKYISLKSDVKYGVIEFRVEIIEKNNFEIVISHPQTVNLMQNRKSPRFQLKLNEFKHHFTIKSGREVMPARFNVTNISSTGFGGFLHEKNPSNYLGLTISGFVIIGVNKQKLSGEIVQLKHQQTYYTKGDAAYIGCKFTLDKKEDGIQTSRKQTRFTYEKVVTIVPVLFQAAAFRVKIREVSTGGFSASFENFGNIKPFCYLGSRFFCSDEGFVCEIVSLSHEGASFRIIRFESTSSSSRWFSSYYTQYSNNVAPNTMLVEQLGNLFTSSGALSSEFINGNKDMLSHVQKHYSNDSTTMPWVVKWLPSSENGLMGNISAIRMSNQFWMVGDMVGSKNKNNKIPKTIRSEFLKMLSDYLTSQDPKCHLIIMWVKDHPFWKGFKEKVKSDYKDYLIEDYYTYYYRIAKSSPKKIFADVKELDSSSPKLINYYVCKLYNLGYKNISNLFDLSLNDFGSTRLKEIIMKTGYIFLRKYFILSQGEKEYLAIISMFPYGSNFNRTVDSIWILPLFSGEISNQEATEFVSTAVAKNLEWGVNAPSIRFITKPEINKISSSLFNSELNMFAMTSDSWEIFI